MFPDRVLPAPVVERLQAELPAVAAEAVETIIREVPSYSEALSGPMGDRIRDAVRLALGGFLSLASTPDSGPATPVLDGAYELGRGEARQGRSMDALLGAYRLGARVSWRRMSAAAVAGGLDAEQLSHFAELVFAYIDELSAASASGHKDQLDSTGRARQHQLERLGRMLLDGHSPEALEAAAEAAGWNPPRTLSAVVLPASSAPSALQALSPATLLIDEGAQAEAVLLVPDADGPRRQTTRNRLRGSGAVLGPAVPWQQVRSSHERAKAAASIAGLGGDLDTEDHLRTLVLHGDPAALKDLRARILAPFDGLRDSSAAALRETLRAWLLLQGRREAVAALLHVHPQTVRYRMDRIRELFGDRLNDPEDVLDMLISLA